MQLFRQDLWNQREELEKQRRIGMFLFNHFLVLKTVKNFM